MFRESALKGMIAAGTYTKERVECIHNLQVKEFQCKAIRGNLIALLKEECGIDNHIILHN